MNRVFVLDKLKKPLMLCHPSWARESLKKGKAKVYRMNPFTIILQERERFAPIKISVKYKDIFYRYVNPIVGHKTSFFFLG